MKKYTLTFLTFLFIFATQNYAQVITNYYPYWAYNVSDDPSFDKNGNMWISTMNAGILKYDGKSWINYTTSDGLVSNEIIALAIDPKNNIWAAAKRGGISKFDGKKWITYDSMDGLPLQQNVAMVSDKNGIIWVGSVGRGISRFDGKNFSTFNAEDGIADNTIVDLECDSKGNIWTITGRGNLEKYDGTVWKTHLKSDVFDSSNIAKIASDQDGNIWCITKAGSLKVFDGSTWKQFENIDEIQYPSVTAVTIDNKNNIWIAVHGKYMQENEILKFDGIKWESYSMNFRLQGHINSIALDDQGKIVTVAVKNQYKTQLARLSGSAFEPFNITYGLPAAEVFDIDFDSKNNVWIATGQRVGGISKFDGTEWERIPIEDGETYDYDARFVHCENDNTWIGTSNRGFFEYNGKTVKKNKDLVFEYLRFNSINTFLNDNDLIWYGTNKGLICFDGEDKTIYSNISIPLEDADRRFDTDSVLFYDRTSDKLIIQYKGGDILHFSIQPSILDNNIISLASSSNGEIWAGTVRGGVFMNSGDTWTNYTRLDGLCSNYVTAIAIDKNGNPWFGTNNGLSTFDGKYWATYSSKDELGSCHISSLAFDSNNHLWIGSNRGVFKYDKIRFTKMSREDGLANNVVNVIRIDSDNNVWVGTNFGISKINP